MRRHRYVDPIPPSVRAEVTQRSGGICERCRHERATQLHHKTKRSQGGQHTAANLVHLGSDCHGWVEANPLAAVAEGFSVQRAAGVA